MNAHFLKRSALLLVCVVSGATFGAGDEAIPYEDDEAQVKPKPKKSTRSEKIREEDEDEQSRDTINTLTHLDDPNIGIGLDFLAGAMLLEPSKGSFADPRFGYGFRFTWEFGRLIPDEVLRELFFVDASWRYAQTSDGTTGLNVTSNEHYFTAAPAAGLLLGEKSIFLAYAQLGIGVNANLTSVRINQAETQVSGAKFLFQYGIGLRARPAITADGSVRLSIRVELTRMVRGYMTDTWLGGSVGVVF